MKYNVEPDIAMFGKAMGNGYAITSVIGRRKIMDAAQSTFISSTFWTERIGPSAALKTLEDGKRKSKKLLIQDPNLKYMEKLAKKHRLPLVTFGLPALIKMKFGGEFNLEYKQL